MTSQQLAIADDVFVSVPKPDSEAEHILRVVMSGSFREMGTLRVFNMPSPADRQVLAARQRMLIESLSFDKDKVALLVTRMLQGYFERSKAINDPKKFAQDVALYVRELALDPKIPTWAVALACGDIRLGNAGISVIHPPSTMALRQLCDQHIWKTRAEIGAITQVLKAEKAPRPISDEERARVSAKFKALAEELRAREAARAGGVDGDPPLTLEQLVEMAGSEEAWSALPAARPYRTATGVGVIAADLVQDVAAG